jgi:mannose-1-phosphate guanylyltransferase
MLDSSGSIIVSSENHLTAVLGLKDIVVVHTPNATLVCPRDKVQEIKRLVKKL